MLSPDRAREPIHGVLRLKLPAFEDGRGRMLEAFRREWKDSVFGDELQVNCSYSREGVIRGLHFHVRQTDYWLPVQGRMKVALFDVRPASPSHRLCITMDLSSEKPEGLIIPPGVAHGFAALSDLHLLYVVNRYYTGADEYGIAWDDPDLGIDWGLERDPVLSERDLSNNRFESIEEKQLGEWFGSKA